MRFWLKQFFSSAKAHRKAAEEVFFVCTISLIPLFALGVIDQLRQPSTSAGELFWSAIDSGQLYLYSFSLFGTLFWLCQKEYENFTRFEPRKYLMFLVFVPSVLILIVYTPGSFTKNFSWHHSYEPLFASIRKGFSQELSPISRDRWRSASGIPDSDRQLIPLNFFLYSLRGVKEDRVLVDRLVEAAIERRYNADFDQLSLFAFHLACSGHWRNSKWPDGRVAGWANDFISKVAWRKGSWNATAFDEMGLNKFLKDHLDAESVTRRKVFTNYQFMLESAGVLVDGELQPPNYAQRWYVDAVQLFWDRHFFDGHLPPSGTPRTLEDAFFDREIHKLLNCDETQARVFVRTAAREYLPRILASRVDQIQTLRDAGAIAA